MASDTRSFFFIVISCIAITIVTFILLKTANATTNKSAFNNLRSQVLTLKPADIGITPTKFKNETWGILMETGYPEGVSSLVVLADGTTSIYLSSGRGYIGYGNQYEVVRVASNKFLLAANKFLNTTKPTHLFPLPSNGYVNFYFLTFHGVRKYSAKEIKLGKGKDSLSSLFHKGHAVVAEIIAQHDHNEP